MSAGVKRRRALAMADQGASSLSNVLVGVFAARALPAEGFGAFGLAWAAYLLVLGASRALVGETLLSRYSDQGAAERATHTPRVLGAALGLSVPLAAITAVAGAVLGGTSGPALVALAAVLPVVVLEDAWRYVLVIDRPGAALAVDVVWLAVVCGAVAVAPPDAGPAWFVLAWGLSAIPALALTALIDRPDVRAVHPTRWLREERRMGARFFGEFVGAQSAAQVTLAALGAIAGLSALAGVRAAQILFGPLNTIHAGIYLAVVPDGARLRSEPDRLRRLARWATVLIVVMAIGWMLTCLLIPDGLGEALFGESWSEGADLILPMGLAMVAGSAATGGFAGVRSLGDARTSVRATLATLPGEVVLPVAGAALAGASGFVWGFVGARVVTAGVWWRAFLGHVPTDAVVAGSESPLEAVAGG